MKKAAKNESPAKNKTKSFQKTKKTTSLKLAKKPVTYKAFKIAEHHETGRLIHHRHTSHLLLFLILMLFGLFLIASDSYVQSLNNSGTVVIGTIVTGPPPEIGSKITYPANDAEFDNALIKVKGSCSNGAFVSIRDDNVFAGSTYCTEAGVFSLQIQLHSGKNVLTSFNYDNLNQAGPATSSVTVYLKNNGQKVATVPQSVISQTIQTLPSNPTTITGLNNNFSDCSNYNVGDIPADDEPHITLVCVPRLFLPELPQTLGILAWGGTPPYAVSVDLGNDSNDLISIPSVGYRTMKFSYAVPNIYKLSFKLKDQTGKQATIQTTVQVSGSISTPTATDSNNNQVGIGQTVASSLSSAPMPLYIVALAVTLGFWGGDLYDRKYGSCKSHKRRRRTV